MDILSYILGFKKGKSMGGGSVEGVHFVTFKNEDGTKELYKRPVADGDNCADIVARGLIDKPTKEMTDAEVYTYSGWSMTSGGAADSAALQNVTEDRTVYAAFTATARKYTARFYDDSGALMQESQVAYGTKATPPDTVKEGYNFSGWTPSDLTIYGDTDFVGKWEPDEGWLVYKEFTSDALLSSAWRMAYSPDGTRLFVYTRSDYMLHMFDCTIQPYEEICSVQIGGTSSYDATSVSEIKISPNGNYLAITNGYSQSKYFTAGVHVFSITSSSLEKITTLGSGTQFSGSRSKMDIEFSTDGEKLYAVTSVGEFGVWDVGAWTMTSLSALGGYRDSYNPSLAATPDGKALIYRKTASYYNQQSVYAIDLTNNYADITSEYFGSAAPTGDGPGHLVISKNGEYIVINGRVSAGDRINIYKKNEEGTPLYSYIRFLNYRTYMYGGSPKFINDGTLVAFATGNTNIYVAESATGTMKEQPYVPVGGNACCCAFSPDGTRLAVGHDTAPYVSLYEVRR